LEALIVYPFTVNPRDRREKKKVNRDYRGTGVEKGGYPESMKC
jgi:hypothetical protein